MQSVWITRILLLLIFQVQPLISYCQLNEVKNFGKNPGNLKMYMHMPKIFIDSTALPLVVALHGCYQDASEIANESGWNSLADKYGFVVIYPEQKRVNNGYKCFNWFRSADNKRDKGESASIKEMIDYTINGSLIDTSRIYIYGLSAGAVMTVQMLGNYPELFNAGVTLAGAPYNSANNSMEAMKAMINGIDKDSTELTAGMNAEKYPKLIIGHGTADNVVEYDNSLVLLAQWCALHKIKSSPKTEECNFMMNENVCRFAYGNQDVIFYRYLNIGHVLPVDPGEGEFNGGHIGRFAKDFDFFSTYYIAKDLQLIPDSE